MADKKTADSPAAEPGTAKKLSRSRKASARAEVNAGVKGNENDTKTKTVAAQNGKDNNTDNKNIAKKDGKKSQNIAKNNTGDKNVTKKDVAKPKNDIKNDTGNKNAIKKEEPKAKNKPKVRTKNNTGSKNNIKKEEVKALNKPENDAGNKRKAQKREPKPKNGTKNRTYLPAEFSSVEMMSSLKGFAPMGMIFVLMDILKGHEEGLIHVNQLAEALNISKPSLFAQLENLEAAGLLRTISSSRAGRHIELLTPNLLRHSALDLYPSGASGNLLVPAQDAPEAGGQFTQKRLDFLHRYLKEHGVEVVSIPDETKLPPDVAQIASFLGKYFPYVQAFYDVMKSTLNDCAEFHYSLAPLSSRNITHTLNFCKMLKSAGFLASCDYRRSQRSIIARVSRSPAAINFLSGGWLEHYVRDKVISILTTHPASLSMPYAFMKNPNILLPGSEPFELDFLLCVGESVFWIEAKTGEYMTYLPKYSRVAKVLGLGRGSSMLVSVNALVPDDNLTARHGLSCCNLDEFPDVFRINLVRELQQEAVRRVP